MLVLDEVSVLVLVEFILVLVDLSELGLDKASVRVLDDVLVLVHDDVSVLILVDESVFVLFDVRCL